MKETSSRGKLTNRTGSTGVAEWPSLYRKRLANSKLSTEKIAWAARNGGNLTAKDKTKLTRQQNWLAKLSTKEAQCSDR